MPQQIPRIHILRFGLRGWAAIGVGAAALIAVVVLALGLFVLFLPILILAPVLFYFLPRLKTYSARKEARNNPAIIDGEFHVVSTTEREENANQRLRKEFGSE